MINFLRFLKRQVEISFFRYKGRVPFARSYPVCRDFYIGRTIHDEAVLRVFREGLQLPTKFGVGLDERVVEYPWVLSKLFSYKEKYRVLDAGSTLNHQFIMRHPLVERQKWTILTLAPEPESFSHLGVSYVYDDLRAMPFRDECFDAVFCISVIEHIGMDNLNYTRDDTYRQNNSQDYIRAVSEIKRVLRPDGWLFLTVPFGRYENHGWLQQFDSAMLLKLICQFQPSKHESTFFRSTASGWQMCTEDDCKDLTYKDSVASKSTLDLKRREVVPPVSATGLACVALQK
jgi:SAM-dependent methyltransferase